MKINFKSGLNKLGKGITKNKSRILTGLGIGLGAATVYFAVKNTPAALMDIEDARLAKDLEGEPFTKLDAIKAAWKHYIPAIATGVTSTALIIASDVMDMKTIASLTQGVVGAQEALRTFKETTKEELGEKKVKAIEDKVAEKELKKHPCNNTEINPTDMGFLCYDANSGRYFKSTWEILNAAVNTVNNKINNEMCATLNDFYDCVGLKDTETGRENGWDQKIQLYPTCHVGGECVDDPDCVVINFTIDPSLEYLCRGH